MNAISLSPDSDTRTPQAPDHATNMPRIILIGIMVCLVYLAWANRFIQDDAFISFRYADHFVKGLGLVYNEGERVEGYTNFLWTMLMTIPHWWRIDVVTFSYGLGLIIFAVNLALTYILGTLVLSRHWHRLLALVFLGTNHTFSAYATGGLETGLVTAWVLCVTCLVVHIGTTGVAPIRQLILLSLCLSGALLTRLDSAILLVGILPMLCLSLYRIHATWSSSLSKVIAVSLPCILVIVTWFGWKSSYYGDIVPNTFYVKVSNLNSLAEGIVYVYRFFESNWLFPFLVLFVLNLPKLRNPRHHVIAVLAMMITLWMTYIINIGGDFMEFRMMVPILPYFYMVLAWLTVERISLPALRGALIVLVFAGSFHHITTFNLPLESWKIERTDQLHSHLYVPDENWIGIGTRLYELFGAHPDSPIIAVTAAGTIPYYSQLTTVDMLGLNDRWIAMHGTPTHRRAGHQKITTLDYLTQRGVHLVIGHPQVIPMGSQTTFSMADVEPLWWANAPETLPAEAQMLLIPIGNGYSVKTLYLAKNVVVDQTIAAHGIPAFAIERSSTHPHSLHARVS